MGGLFVVWTYLSIKNGAMSGFNDGVLTIVGIICGTKAIHAYGESYSPSSKKPPAETGKTEEKK